MSSRQTPEQNVSAGGQWHAPDVQTWPAPHGRPQAPQFAGSLSVSVQPFAHAAWLPGQTHWPSTQGWPPPHAVLQTPQ